MEILARVVARHDAELAHKGQGGERLRAVQRQAARVVDEVLAVRVAGEGLAADRDLDLDARLVVDARQLRLLLVRRGGGASSSRVVGGQLLEQGVELRREMCADGRRLLGRLAAGERCLGRVLEQRHVDLVVDVGERAAGLGVSSGALLNRGPGAGINVGFEDEDCHLMPGSAYEAALEGEGGEDLTADWRF
ncbi:hypothetical protein VTK26DRAFT_2473 [Humicola hyalothermophila]